METIDAYVHHIRQVATFSGYQERATNIRSFQKPTSYKTILSSFPNNGFMTGSRNREENLNQRENRQAISRTDILDSLYEHKRRIQQEKQASERRQRTE